VRALWLCWKLLVWLDYLDKENVLVRDAYLGNNCLFHQMPSGIVGVELTPVGSVL